MVTLGITICKSDTEVIDVITPENGWRILSLSIDYEKSIPFPEIRGRLHSCNVITLNMQTWQNMKHRIHYRNVKLNFFLEKKSLLNDEINIDCSTRIFFCIIEKHLERIPETE